MWDGLKHTVKEPNLENCLRSVLKMVFKLIDTPKEELYLLSYGVNWRAKLKMIHGPKGQRKVGNSHIPKTTKIERKTINEVYPGDNKSTYGNQ